MRCTKSQSVASGRNYGIDTLRILSMLMIVTVHILTQGGVLAAAEQGSVNWYAAWALRIFFICDVNCFALISGYVSVDSRFRTSRVVSLWFQVFAYSVGITAVFRLIGWGGISAGQDVLPHPFGSLVVYDCLFWHRLADALRRPTV